MITLSNGHRFQYMVASGALGFTGRGWFWERPLVWLNIIQPELFTVVLKTLTRHDRIGNLCWWKPWTWLPWSPWSCVRLLPNDGAVNKIGLTNKGMLWWYQHIAPTIDFKKYNLVASIYGTKGELMDMAIVLNDFAFVAIEVNVSCPNTGHGLSAAEETIESVKAVRRVSNHPIIVKVSVDQEYLAIAAGLAGTASAISLNSVPWSRVFGTRPTPLAKLEKKVGGGGVSGRPAQSLNWRAVQLLSSQGALPVIGPSITRKEDLNFLEGIGARAFSFGAIHLRTPWLPTRIVKHHRLEQAGRELYESINQILF